MSTLIGADQVIKISNCSVVWLIFQKNHGEAQLNFDLFNKRSQPDPVKSENNDQVWFVPYETLRTQLLEVETQNKMSDSRVDSL